MNTSTDLLTTAKTTKRRTSASRSAPRTLPTVETLSAELERLRESELRLRRENADLQAFNRAYPDINFILAPDGTFLSCWTSNERALLLPPSEVLGKRTRDVMPPDVAELLQDAIDRVNRDGQVVLVEYDLPVPSGSGSFEARLAPLPGQRISVIVRDVSERKQQETALRESEARFARAFHNNHVAFGMRRLRDDVIIEVNASLERLLGLPRDSIVGRTVTELDLYTAPGVRQELLEAGAKREPVEGLEVQLRDKGGGLRHALLSVCYLQAAGEECALASFIDITERRRMEQALRQSEAALRESETRLRTIVESEPECVKLLDSEFRLLDMNPAGMRIIGARSWEEVRGLSVLQLVDPNHHQLYREGVAAVFRGESTHQIFEIIGLDSKHHWMEQYAVPFWDSERPGQVKEMLAVTRDISDRIDAEKAIRRTLREKETLLREIHHRVKNNLQIISSLLHFQAKKVHDSQAAGVFREARERLRSMILVHELLYGSNDVSGVDLDDYVQSLVDQLAKSFSDTRRPVEFRLETVPLRLPIETALPCGMILVELVTNVLKYAFPGDRVGQATVRITTEPGRFHLIVEDNGVGLPADFSPENGASFGWQLIQNLARQLNGKVRVERETGTRITVSLPRPESSPGP